MIKALGAHPQGLFLFLTVTYSVYSLWMRALSFISPS